MTWQRIIRFVGQDGQEHFGEPIIESAGELATKLEAGTLTAKELAGSDLFEAAPTGQTLQVKTLLGPLRSSDVPIVRCIGLNYIKHIQEGGRKPPPYPSVFIKPAETITSHDSDIPIPKVVYETAEQLDYEAELCIVIGKTCKDVPASSALDYIAGYTAGNDVSARAWQRDPALAGGVPQWCFSKGFDRWCPVGPVIVSPRVLDKAHGLSIKTWVNGELRQDSDTGDLLFGVPEIVAFVSQGTTLPKGTVIMTGTPAGVAMGMKPEPKWLKNGDVVEVEIGEIGRLRNKMVYEGIGQQGDE
ncbi:fumarylacetoacetate hydrolase domain-containing protein 2 [Pyricularia oryzae]|uniref:Fumarylacetoacetate hydrolase domain-containing protein 2 n=2 Tax=Pyricularia oryzae TaxID=318829 RepID=A0AA97NME6_PYRO3|nr:fumarylacetoacetate hydrolase domain-containing protein 2 [Pyricularia oryzae Y34]KAI6262747.1 hypothetical protein MCOR19_001087 [Pyricularia oryzae]KAI6282198.1 hypothetical protein MCOR26_002967 [Pyricularia oryzae]KAI6339738.1 hypothetical protein MCOR30_002734 [Pyricularia oryzae]KAI6342592.1 hypothetical protein MCOR28_005307 [Pyricularia oryzae]